MPVFDTNVLVALFDNGHEDHRKAQQAFRTADTVLLHPCVVTEFTTVIRRNAKAAGQNGNQVARQALASLLNQPRVRIVHDMVYDDVIELYLAAPTLSFTDAVVSEAYDHFDKKASVTFDENIAASRKISDDERRSRAKGLDFTP